jgi:hypothetical protein
MNAAGLLVLLTHTVAGAFRRGSDRDFVPVADAIHAGVARLFGDTDGDGIDEASSDGL